MKIFILSLFYFLLVGADSSIQPQQDPEIGDDTGTPQLEEMNTSPNPVPSQNESENSGGSIIQKQEDVKKQRDGEKREKLIEGSPLNQSNGHYRKGL